MCGCSENATNRVAEFPDHSGTVSLAIRPIHPFLAEYEYDVKVALKSEKSFAIPLQPQNGGQPRILIVWYGRHDGQGPVLNFTYQTSSDQVQQCVDLEKKISLSSETETAAYSDKMQSFRSAAPVKLIDVQ